MDKIYSHIIGMGYYVPEKVIKNSYFESIMDTSDEWIYERTGIKERRFINNDEGPSDLAIPAIKMAFENDVLIVWGDGSPIRDLIYS